MGDFQQYEKELSELIILGEEFVLDILLRYADLRKLRVAKERKELVKDKFEKNYHSWYTVSHTVVKQLIPDRLAEFELLYKGDNRSRKYVYAENYTIQDWLYGLRARKESGSRSKIFNEYDVIHTRLTNQLGILRSAELRFSNALLSIKQLTQADVFDSELEAAQELQKQGFYRAAGIVAGVVLEGHLKQVGLNHNLNSRKRKPTINDFNELLKSNEVIDIPTWRKIQHLADLRNICGHKGEREPTKEQILELIDGVAKYTKTLF